MNIKTIKGLYDHDIQEINGQFEDDVNRLTGEWIIHSILKLCVDFDDTISPWKHFNQIKCNEIINLVLRCQKIGAHIIIHTAGHIDNYDRIKNYCAGFGIEVASINKNPTDMHFGNWGKPYANWFLDDRAGLVYAKKVLARAADNVEFYLNNLKKN